MPSAYTLWLDSDAPDWRGATIDRTAYTSAARLALEQEHVFARTWQLAGRADQVRQPGEYFTCEVAGESILVVHAGREGLRAYYNACRHRGRQLIAPGACGRMDRVRCPYHGWTYALDGRLRGAPDADAFSDLDIHALGLKPVALDVWNGLVFVNLHGAEPSLRHSLEPFADVLNVAFVPAVLVGVKAFELEANWKIVLEAFIETNHIATLHPRVGKGLLFERTSIAHFRRHSLSAVPTKQAADWEVRRTRHWHDWTTDPSTVELHYLMFPNVSIHLFAWGLTFLFRCVPDTRNPERTRLDVWSWMRLREGETPPPPLSMPDAMGQVFQQDYENIPLVQRGVRSQSFTGPKLSIVESRIGHLHAALGEMLPRDAAGPDSG